MLMQCLLFDEREAREDVYRIATIVNLNIKDYVSCIDDLSLIIKRLPK